MPASTSQMPLAPRSPRERTTRPVEHIPPLPEQYGAPASTLTDNGSVYTSRFTGGRNAFEYVLPLLGIRQKNGSPGHPQTQGRSSASTRPRSAGSKPDHQPPISLSCSSSSTRFASTTTSTARTAHYGATPPASLPSQDSRGIRFVHRTSDHAWICRCGRRSVVPSSKCRFCRGPGPRAVFHRPIASSLSLIWHER